MQIYFNNTFPDRNSISKSTAQYTVNCFLESGSVEDRFRFGRPTAVTDEDSLLGFLKSVIENPNTSVRSVSQTHEISRESVCKVLKKSGFKAYGGPYCRTE